MSARRQVRDAARGIVGADHFREVYTDIAPHVSAARKAARGKKPPLLKRIRRAVRRVRSRPGSDSYEVPTAPDLTIDTISVPPEDNALAILDMLVARGYVRSEAAKRVSPDASASPASPATADDRAG